MEKALKRHHSERNSAIELLRIFAGISVIVLHFNFWNLHVVELTTGFTKNILLLFETLCVCAVNIFILISGYCNANNRKINVGRLMDLVFQTSAFSFCFAVMGAIMHDVWSVKSLLGSMLPVNYYVILYVTLMSVAPFINLVMDKLSKESLRKFIWISLLIFSLYPTLVDALEECLGRTFMGLNSISIKGSIGGYTIINFMLVYVIGVYIRKNEFVKKYNASILMSVAVFAFVSIFIWHELLPKTAYNYSNPFVIIEASAIFILFARLNFKHRLINIIAPASFTCFLIHGHFLNLIGKHILIENQFLFVMSLLATCVIGIYIISVAIMYIWNVIAEYTIAYVTTNLSVVEINEERKNTEI